MPRQQRQVNVRPGQIIVTLDQDELDEIADALLHYRRRVDDREFTTKLRNKIVKRSRLCRYGEERFASGSWIALPSGCVYSG